MISVLALALGAVAPLPLAYLAKTADLVAIGTVRPARKGVDEIGQLAIERAFKGKPEAIVSVLATDEPDFACDITAVTPGERALFFLHRDGAGYRIMHSGRGKLVLSEDGRQADLPYDLATSTSCEDGKCPLKALLAELRPWLGKTRPTAFLMGLSGVTYRPSREIRCEVLENEPMSCGKTGAPQEVDLLCFEKPGTLICLPMQ